MLDEITVSTDARAPFQQKVTPLPLPADCIEPPPIVEPFAPPVDAAVSPPVAVAAIPPVPAESNSPRESLVEPRVRGSIDHPDGGSRPAIRSRLLGFCQQTPAWLASLIIHIAIMILFASLIMPTGKRHFGDLLLTMMGSPNTGSNDVGESGLEAIALVSSSRLPADGRSEDVHSAVPDPLDSIQIEIESAFQSSLAQDGQREANLTLSALEQSNLAPASGEWQTVLSQQVSSATALLENRASDDAVERFIQFDIGRLPGDEGQRARRDFDALGIEHLPALVRGFNRSASISASCPVRVLESKLYYLLERTDDPSAVRYVLDNVGKGVPANAVYAQVLASFRHRMLSRAQGEEYVRSALVEREIDADAEMIQSIDKLLLADVEQILKKLADADRQESTAAVIAVSLRSTIGVMTPGQRAAVARSLLQHLTAGDEQLRKQVHRALLNLSFDDVGGTPGDEVVRANPEQAAEQWTASWDRFREKHSIDERSEAALQIALNCERNLQTKRAIERFRQIVAEYPGTGAAKVSADHLRSYPAPKSAQAKASQARPTRAGSSKRP